MTSERVDRARERGGAYSPATTRDERWNVEMPSDAYGLDDSHR